MNAYFSVVIPVYNEFQNLVRLQQELEAALKESGSYEIIYVDDGSEDGSVDVLKEIASRSSQVKVVFLARHFGQTEAMQAGMDHASGDILVFLDADLQNDPRDIPRLLSKLNEGYDIVSGWRRKRKDSMLLRNIPSLIANWLILKLSGVRLHDFGCTLKAYRKEVLKEVRLYSEMHRLIPIYAVRQGGRLAEIEVSHRKRVAGKSKYGLSRVFRVILDFFVAEFMNTYLSRPMYVFGGYGMGLIGCSFLVAGIISVRKLFFGGEWVSPLLFIFVILFIVGVQLFLMGLIAEITMRVYYENNSRKTYRVRKGS